MKAGDTIQIRQHDFLHDALKTISDPPIHGPGPIDMWIYARVLEVFQDGRVRVIVEHAGNRLHHTELILAPVEDDDKGNPVQNVRTKAEVEALAEAQHHTNPGWNAKLQQHFKIQADRLT